MTVNPLPEALRRPIVFDAPIRLVAPGSWAGHIPFAFWLVDVLRPRVIVELGTHTGNSYSAFLQAVRRCDLDCSCSAIDTWKGDEHAGFYGDDVFQELDRFHSAQFPKSSRLIRSSFDEAAPLFKDQSIDILHLDGLHTYEALEHDLNTWLPKMASRGVILIHDICVYDRNFGAYKVWEEITTRYPNFGFLHSHGLGVLGVGREFPPDLQWLFELPSNAPDQADLVQRFFDRLGTACVDRIRLDEFDARCAKYEQSASDLQAQIAGLQDELAAARAEFSALAEERDHLSARLDKIMRGRDRIAAGIEDAARWHRKTAAGLLDVLQSRYGLLRTFTRAAPKSP